MYRNHSDGLRAPHNPSVVGSIPTGPTSLNFFGHSSAFQYFWCEGYGEIVDSLHDCGRIAVEKLLESSPEFVPARETIMTVHGENLWNLLRAAKL
jgi:hypothetical protein